MIISSLFPSCIEHYKKIDQIKDLTFFDSSSEGIIERIKACQNINELAYFDFTSNIAALESASFFISTKNLLGALNKEFSIRLKEYEYVTAASHLNVLIAASFNFLLYCESQKKDIIWIDIESGEVDPIIAQKINRYVDKNHEVLGDIVSSYGLIIK